MIGEKAKKVLKIEAKAILSLINSINKQFEKAIELLYSCKGRIVLTAIGKSGFIARKISATLASTGTPSLYLHPAEAIHGDLGMVIKDDVVIAISTSGETKEILCLIPSIKEIGAKIIALTGNLSSTLAQESDVVINTSVKKEEGILGLAPISNTIVSLAMGDALTIELLEKKQFTLEKYAFYHPGGSLGKKLLKIKDIMRKKDANPVVNKESKVLDVLLAITKARAGAASIVDKKGKLVGIFTDGDLRRHIEKGINITTEKIKNIMTKNPKTITGEKFVIDAIKILQKNRIDELPVVNKDNKPIGMLDIQDVVKV